MQLEKHCTQWERCFLNLQCINYNFINNWSLISCCGQSNLKTLFSLYTRIHNATGFPTKNVEQLEI